MQPPSPYMHMHTHTHTHTHMHTPACLPCRMCSENTEHIENICSSMLGITARACSKSLPELASKSLLEFAFEITVRLFWELGYTQLTQRRDAWSFESPRVLCSEPASLKTCTQAHTHTQTQRHTLTQLTEYTKLEHRRDACARGFYPREGRYAVYIYIYIYGSTVLVYHKWRVNKVMV